MSVTSLQFVPVGVELSAEAHLQGSDDPRVWLVGDWLFLELFILKEQSAIALTPPGDWTLDAEFDENFHVPGIGAGHQVYVKTAYYSRQVVSGDVQATYDAVWSVADEFPAWASGVSYSVGDVVQFGGAINMYQCAIAHVSGPDFDPDKFQYQPMQFGPFCARVTGVASTPVFAGAQPTPTDDMTDFVYDIPGATGWEYKIPDFNTVSTITIGTWSFTSGDHYHLSMFDADFRTTLHESRVTAPAGGLFYSPLPVEFGDSTHANSSLFYDVVPSETVRISGNTRRFHRLSVS